MKLKMLLFIIFLVVICYTFILYKADKAHTEFLLSHPPKLNDEGINIQTAFVRGITKEGNKYTIKSNTITHIEKKRYKLLNVDSRYFLNPALDNFIDILSQDGIFDSDQNIASLSNNVRIIFSEGDILNTEKLDINFNKHIIYTNHQVLYKKNDANIISKNGLESNLTTKIVRFIGPVNTQIFRQKNITNIDCDEMNVEFAETDVVKGIEKTNQVKKMIFKSNVVLSDKTQIAKGNIGEYIVETNIITISGNAKLKTEGKYVEAEKIIYNNQNGDFKILSSAATDGRVRVILEG